MNDEIGDYLIFFRSKLGRMDVVTFEIIEQVIAENPAFISQLTPKQLELIRKKTDGKL